MTSKNSIRILRNVCPEEPRITIFLENLLPTATPLLSRAQLLQAMDGPGVYGS
jgi:hypothetical protein